MRYDEPDPPTRVPDAHVDFFWFIVAVLLIALVVCGQFWPLGGPR